MDRTPLGLGLLVGESGVSRSLGIGEHEWRRSWGVDVGDRTRNKEHGT